MKALHQALAFLTPLGGPATPGPGALAWFGVVGALVGAAVGAVFYGAEQVLPPLVAAAVAITTDAALTGLLHLDGLADTADGLLPPLPAERRLAVMRDPHVGAFGVVTLVLVVALRISALAYVAARPATILAVAALWCAARTAMAVTATAMTYARPAGLAIAFVGTGTGTGTGDRNRGRPWLVPLAAGAPLALVLGALGTRPGLLGILAVAAAGIGAAIVVTFARGRIGGFTGDVLGAAGVIAETTGLILLVVGT